MLPLFRAIVRHGSRHAVPLRDDSDRIDTKIINQVHADAFSPPPRQTQIIFLGPVIVGEPGKHDIGTKTLSKTGTAQADADAVEARPNTAPYPDTIDEQRCRTAPGGKAAFDELVTVNEIGTNDLGLGDLDHRNRIVGLPRLIDGQHGVRRVCAEIVFAGLCPSTP